MTIFEKLKAGQRVFVINPDNGKKFSKESFVEALRARARR